MLTGKLPVDKAAAEFITHGGQNLVACRLSGIPVHLSTVDESTGTLITNRNTCLLGAPRQQRSRVCEAKCTSVPNNVRKHAGRTRAMATALTANAIPQKIKAKQMPRLSKPKLTLQSTREQGQDQG